MTLTAGQQDAIAEQAEALLLQVQERCTGRMDREEVHRALGESVQAVPGLWRHTWPVRLRHACTGLGLECQSLYLTITSAVEMGDVQAPLVSLGQDNTWSLFDGNAQGVMRFAGDLVERQSLSNLAPLLPSWGVASAEEVVPWLLVHARPNWPADANGHAKHPGDEHADQPSPQRRLWDALRPEWADVRLLLVFAAVVSVLSLATPLAVDALVSSVVFTNLLQPLVVLSLVLFMGLGLAAVLRGLETWVVELLQQRLFVRVLGDLAWRLPQVRYGALHSAEHPELINRTFEVVTLQKVVASLLVDGVDVILQVLVSMLVLAMFHPWLLGYDVVLVTLMSVLIFVLGRGGVRTAIEESHAKHEAIHWLEEIARSPRLFKSPGGDAWAWRRMDRLVTQYLTHRREHFGIVFRQVAALLGLQAVAATMLLGLGGWLVMQFELTLGQLVAAELMVSVVISSFTKLGKYVESWYDLMASVQKLSLLTDLPLEAEGGAAGVWHAGPLALSVEGVTLCAEHGLRAQAIEWTVAAGERVAIWSEHGGGKSWLADLVDGLRFADAGRVLVGGVDTRSWRLTELRGAVAVVRDAEILSDTIAMNVAAGREVVTPGRIAWALELCELTRHIGELTVGVETRLGFRGAPLSNSQIIRLMIARAIAPRPGLLVIDGLLDGLEEGTQSRLLQRLTQADLPWTLVVLTSRRELAAALPRQLQLRG